jgi:hypothetical protein
VIRFCKSVGSAFVGSNPSLPKTRNSLQDKELRVFYLRIKVKLRGIVLLFFGGHAMLRPQKCPAHAERAELRESI